jgi:hypothetical protein
MKKSRRYVAKSTYILPLTPGVTQNSAILRFSRLIYLPFHLSVYVDVCDGSCLSLGFQLGNTGIGATLATRSWSIKVTQYDCNYENLAPTGCTQYFFGSASQSVQTYNFAGGQHLANQKQQICVRQD